MNCTAKTSEVKVSITSLFFFQIQVYCCSLCCKQLQSMLQTLLSFSNITLQQKGCLKIVMNNSVMFYEYRITMRYIQNVRRNIHVLWFGLQVVFITCEKHQSIISLPGCLFFFFKIYREKIKLSIEINIINKRTNTPVYMTLCHDIVKC